MDMLQEKHGHQKATLIMHTDPFDDQGANLLKTSELLGTQKSVVFSKERVDFAEVAALHNISDFTLNVSCFPAGTRVATRRGYIPIENITPGDETITHKGRWRQITHVIKQPKREWKMKTFKVSNSNPLTCTDDHKLLAIKRNELPEGLLF
jgi:hypothetical protein